MKLMVVIPPKKASNVDCSAVLSQLDQQILQNTHEIRVFYAITRKNACQIPSKPQIYETTAQPLCRFFETGISEGVI